MSTCAGREVVTAHSREVTRSLLAQAREAVSQLASMARLGVQPDTQAATALIYACTRNGNMEMAQAAFEELFGARCRLQCTYAAHLQALFEPHERAGTSSGPVKPGCDLTFGGHTRSCSALEGLPRAAQAAGVTSLRVRRVGDLLMPDDVTFSVLVRGYGECEPVQWTAISGLLSLMERKYSQPPSISARRMCAVGMRCLGTLLGCADGRRKPSWLTYRNINNHLF